MMIDLKGKKLILASKSPRRSELLQGLQVPFEVIGREVSEDYPDYILPEQVAAYLSKKKALAFEEELEDNEIVLTSDTVVILKGEILGKPSGPEEARSMLESLSGNQHQVMTALTFLSKEKQETVQDIAKVIFKSLTKEEIDFYIQQFSPYDKAGAYGIQEWIGYIGAVHLEGSFYTVMGLPVHLVYEVLSKW
jgi:septum formation protein